MQSAEGFNESGVNARKGTLCQPACLVFPYRTTDFPIACAVADAVYQYDRLLNGPFERLSLWTARLSSRRSDRPRAGQSISSKERNRGSAWGRILRTRSSCRSAVQRIAFEECGQQGFGQSHPGQVRCRKAALTVDGGRTKSSRPSRPALSNSATAGTLFFTVENPRSLRAE